MNNNYIRYVVGFMFNSDLSRMVVIKKLNPEWQRGKFNGVGGKIEPGESDVAAMVREFKEETGVDTEAARWNHFLSIVGRNQDMSKCDVEYFFYVGDVDTCQTQEAETIYVVDVLLAKNAPSMFVQNCAWIIECALCNARGQWNGSLGNQIREVVDSLEWAWCIIANAGGGNWQKETEQWAKAAAAWRDKYHEIVNANRPGQQGQEPRGCVGPHAVVEPPEGQAVSPAAVQ